MEMSEGSEPKPTRWSSFSAVALKHCLDANAKILCRFWFLQPVAGDMRGVVEACEEDAVCGDEYLGVLNIILGADVVQGVLGSPSDGGLW